MIRFFHVLLLAALPVSAGALLAKEPAGPVKPMLWKIEGKALVKPSYLFGSVHVGVPSVTKLHPATEKAFTQADSVYTEVPMDAASQVAASVAVVRSDGKTLAEAIGEDLSKRLDVELQAINPELDASALQSFKTWAVATAVPILKFQLGGEKSLDAAIWDRAAKDGKKTGALEKPADQLAIFNDLTEAEQGLLLADTLKQLQDGRKSGKDPVTELIEAYVSGDESRLEKEVSRQLEVMAEGPAKELSERILKRVLHDRNVTMTATIAGLLDGKPSESHFFTAGTAHYVGKGSIVELLTAKGYQVTRISE